MTTTDALFALCVGGGPVAAATQAKYGIPASAIALARASISQGYYDLTPLAPYVAGYASGTLSVNSGVPLPTAHLTTGSRQAYWIGALDTSGLPVTWTATGLPSGLVISSVSACSGLISGTPTGAGTSSVTVTATDANGGTTSATLSVVVTGAGAPNTVTVTNPGSQSLTAGTTYNLTVAASDSASGQTLTWTASGLPPGLSISSGGVISGTPSAPASAITWRAGANATTSASQTAALTIVIPSSCQAGDIVLIGASIDTGSGSPTMTVTSSGTTAPTRICGPLINTAGGNVSSVYCVPVVSGDIGKTISITPSATAYMGAVIGAWAGCRVSGQPDVEVSGGPTSTATFASPVATTVTAGDWAVYFARTTGSSAFTGNPGTMRENDANYRAGFADSAGTVGGAGTSIGGGNWTCATAATWLGFTIGLAPLASGVATATVTATDTTGANGSASFTMTVGGTGGSTGPSWNPSGTWTLVFDDEFTGAALDTAYWTPGWFGTGTSGPINSAETTGYDSANVSVSASNLNLLLTSTPITTGGYTYPNTGACVSSNPNDGRASGGFEFTYGCVEWRAYLPPSASGTEIANWPALWMDGQSWPTDGEFDIMEGLGGTAQWHIPTNGNVGGPSSPTSLTGWHTFGVMWLSSGSVTFYYDGVAVSSGVTAPNTTPMYLIMDNTQGSYGGTSTFPSNMMVDWVRVWQLGGGGGGGVSFYGAVTPNAAVWGSSPAFADDFSVLCARGSFLSTYTSWSGYPTNFASSDGTGYYDPGQVSVIATTDEESHSIQVMDCYLQAGVPSPPAGHGGGNNAGTAMYPNVLGIGTGVAGMRVEMRVRVVNGAANWTLANLLWPEASSPPWPQLGEIDYWNQEANAGVIQIFSHRYGGTTGGDQDYASVTASQAVFHVICVEWLPGASITWYVDGVQEAQFTDYIPPSSDPMRLVMQNESGSGAGGDPTPPSASMHVQYNWIKIHFPT